MKSLCCSDLAFFQTQFQTQSFKMIEKGLVVGITTSSAYILPYYRVERKYPPSCLHMKNDGCLTRHPSVDSYSLCNKLDMIIKPLYCLVLHCLKHISIRVERHMDVCMAKPGFENNCRHSRLYTPRSECMPQLMLSV